MLQSRRQGQWGTAEYDKAAIHGVNQRAYKALEVRNTNEYFKIYLIVINITAFAMMGIDKKRAKKHEWRIPEARLFGAAFIGGGTGAVLGMYFFRHKTKHWYFVVGMPLIMILNFAIIYLLAIYCFK